MSKITRRKALEELRRELEKENISVRFDSEARQFLDWAARNKGVQPSDIYAIAIGDDIFIRPEYNENVRVLREEFIHIQQQ